MKNPKNYFVRPVIKGILMLLIINSYGQESKIFTSGITEQTTPLSKVKEPLTLDEIKVIKGRFSTPNWQSAGDDGVYVNMHLN